MPTKRHEEEEQAEVRKHEQAEALWPRHPRRRATETAASILMGQTVVATAVVLLLCYVAKLVLVVLLVSVLIAFILAPLVNLLEMTRIPRPVGSFIAVVALGALLYGGLYFGCNSVSGVVQDAAKYSIGIKHAVILFREQAQKIQQTTEHVL